MARSQSQKPKSRRSVPRLRIRRARLIDLEHLVSQRRTMWAGIGITDRRELDRADREYHSWARNVLRRGTRLDCVVEEEKKEVAGSGGVPLQPIEHRPGTRTSF